MLREVRKGTREGREPEREEKWRTGNPAEELANEEGKKKI